MFTDNTIKEFVRIYEKASKCAKEKKHRDFYTCLKNCLVEEAEKAFEPQKMLLNYKMCAKSYVESKFADFNIGVSTFLFAILGIIINLNKETQTVCEKWFIPIVLVVTVGISTILLIYLHRKNRKIMEILFVLESKDIEISLNSHKNKEHVKEYRVNEEIAKKFADICKEKKVVEKEQLEKIMQQFVANETKK